MKLLVVDDHAVVIEGVAALLRGSSTGPQVLVAADVQAALAAVADHPDLDAALLDLRRPGLSGEIYVPPLLARDERPDGVRDRAAMTGRQAEVLDCPAAELSNKQIAYKLSLSEKRVKAHVTAVLRNLGAANRQEAVRSSRGRSVPIDHQAI